jgi:threo-3-hydroxy-L-aspartate ammonia-lyase
MTIPAEPLPISIDDVRAAAGRLQGLANRTPVLTSRTLDERTGLRLFFKCENYQRVGAFKFRGAHNAIVQIPADIRAKGVAAASSGNHAQGVALAAKLLGVPAVICMPADAPKSKRAATEGYGAEVIEFDRQQVTPDEAVAKVAGERGLTIVPPFDHPHVMAGQGTVALELWEDYGPFDALIVPLGGGGLLSGCATVARALSPECRIIGVETEGADDWVQSLAKGERVIIPPPTTIADGIRSRRPGEQPWRQVRALVDHVGLVSDEEVKEAMRYLVLRMKTLVEPTGAVAPAMALSGRHGITPGAKVGVVISGGNCDADVLCDVLGQ